MKQDIDRQRQMHEQTDQQKERKRRTEGGKDRHVDKHAD
jgi:hypothetical protein